MLCSFRLNNNVGRAIAINPISVIEENSIRHYLNLQRVCVAPTGLASVNRTVTSQPSARRPGEHYYYVAAGEKNSINFISRMLSQRALITPTTPFGVGPIPTLAWRLCVVYSSGWDFQWPRLHSHPSPIYIEAYALELRHDNFIGAYVRARNLPTHCAPQ